MTGSDSSAPAPQPTGDAPARITARSGPAEVRAALAPALHVQRWLDDVAARAPFPSFVHLLDAAVAAADSLSEAEIDEAIAGSPRTDADPADDTAVQLASGHAAYEERFGRVFLVRTAGRSSAEILGELHRRLQLDDATELREVAEQLREIALLRIGQLWLEAP